jgi:hypothetical protein
MRAADVERALAGTEPPPEGSGYAAVRALGARGEALVGWEPEDVAVLLLPAQAGPCPEIRLKHLDVLPSAEVTIRAPGTDTLDTRRSAVLRCRCEDVGLRLAFAGVAAILLDVLEANGKIDLDVQIPSLERLFSAFQREAQTTVIGLWGELLVIAEAVDPIEAAQAWHLDPSQSFDFRATGRALDVKTSRDAAREHWVSLDQWRVRDHATCELVSLIVAPVDDGVSVADLLDQVTERLTGHPLLQSKVLEVAARTLGQDFQKATQERFDHQAARASIRYVMLDDVPHGDFDAGVLDARWKAALEHVTWRPATSWGALSPRGSAD